MTPAVCALALLAVAVPPSEVRVDATEARAVLAILDSPSDANWTALFQNNAYRRLKERETSMHRAFEDESFRRFVLAPETAARREALRRTLDAWTHADIAAIATRVRAFLPAEARLTATVYPVIKPQPNSFVFDAGGDPAIFLFVDPDMSEAEFASTVAHELHHIGLASTQEAYDASVVQKAPAEVRPVLTWIGAFGEGLAVLAAAGSADVHPLHDAREPDRIRWDQDMKGFGGDLRSVELFLLDILRGGFKDEATIQHVAMHFFGYRGPWYTVGYRMGALVEQKLGRSALIECMRDPRELLWRYNELVPAGDPLLPRWSDELLARIGQAAKR